MTVVFEHRTEIGAPPDVVFGLSLDIDAHLASMARSRERAIAGVTTGQIGLGEEVTWRARHFAVPFRMTSRVTALDRPHRFVDEQTRGPFRRFHHEHRFEATDSGTVMIDAVSFDAPLGQVGRLFECLVLGRYIRRLIEERAAFLKHTAEDRPA